LIAGKAKIIGGIINEVTTPIIMLHWIKRLNTPWVWMPLALVGYVLVSGLTQSCPTCVAITDSIGLTASTASGPVGSDRLSRLAPDWQLPDLEGDTVSSEDFNGRVVLIDFWATWCPPCRAMVPTLVELHEDYADEGFEVVAISQDRGGSEEVTAFNRKHGVNYTSLMGDGSASEAFGGIRFLPTSFLIGPDGTILERHIGQTDRETLEPGIRKALGLE